MPPIATRLDPPRGRAGDVIRIVGSGFSVTAGQNEVTVDSIPATILSISESEVVIVAPAGLVENFQAVVSLSNFDELDPAQRTTALAWLVLPPAAEFPDLEVKAQQPHPLEQLARENPLRPEAKDWERIAALLTELWQEVLPGEEGADRLGLDRDTLEAIGLSSDRVGPHLEELDARVGPATTPAVAVSPRTVGTPAEGPGGYPRTETRLGAYVFGAGELEVGDLVKLTAWGLIGDEPIDGHELALVARFGGTDLVAYQAEFPGQFGWRLEATVLVTGDATQEAVGAIEIGQRRINQKSNPSLTDLVELSSPAAAISSSVLLEVTGQDIDGPAITNGVVDKVVRMTGFVVETIPASVRGSLSRRPADVASVADVVLVEVPNPTVSIADSVDVTDQALALPDPVQLTDAIATSDQIAVDAAAFPSILLFDQVDAEDLVLEAGSLRFVELLDTILATDVVTREDEVLIGDTIATTDSGAGARTRGRELLDELDQITEAITVEVEQTSVLWSGDSSNTLYEQSGQFTSTVRASQPVGSIDSVPTGISTRTNLDTPWSGDQANKLYLQSGRFTSTLKTSQAVGGIDSNPEDVSTDQQSNSPWCGSQGDKLYLTSGQFTGTLKTSLATSTFGRNNPRGISYDENGNTPVAMDSDNNLVLISGQFTSTVKDSLAIGGINSSPQGISYSRIGPVTLWCGTSPDKLYINSGQFTSTLRTSQSVSGIDSNCRSIELGSELGRGIVKQVNVSVDDTIAVADTVDVERAPILEDAVAAVDCPVQVLVEGPNLVELYLTDCVQVEDEVEVFDPISGALITGGALGNPELLLIDGVFSTTILRKVELGPIAGASSFALGISDAPPTEDTVWLESDNGWLFLQSGRFTQTVKQTQALTGFDAFPSRCSSDDEGNVVWCGTGDDKLYLQSGRLTSTLKTSQAVTDLINGVSFDGQNTLWMNRAGTNRKMFLQSGKFTATVKTSQSLQAVNEYAVDLSRYKDDTSVSRTFPDNKLILYSGQFSTTVTASAVIDNGGLGAGYGIETLPTRDRLVGRVLLQEQVQVVEALLVELLPGSAEAIISDLASVGDELAVALTA